MGVGDRAAVRIDYRAAREQGVRWSLERFQFLFSLRFELEIASQINGKLFISWAGVCTLRGWLRWGRFHSWLPVISSLDQGDFTHCYVRCWIASNSNAP